MPVPGYDKNDHLALSNFEQSRRELKRYAVIPSRDHTIAADMNCQRIEVVPGCQYAQTLSFLRYPIRSWIKLSSVDANINRFVRFWLASVSDGLGP